MNDRWGSELTNDASYVALEREHDPRPRRLPGSVASTVALTTLVCSQFGAVESPGNDGFRTSQPLKDSLARLVNVLLDRLAPCDIRRIFSPSPLLMENVLGLPELMRTWEDAELVDTVTAFTRDMRRTGREPTMSAYEEWRLMQRFVTPGATTIEFRLISFRELSSESVRALRQKRPAHRVLTNERNPTARLEPDEAFKRATLELGCAPGVSQYEQWRSHHPNKSQLPSNKVVRRALGKWQRSPNPGHPPRPNRRRSALYSDEQLKAVLREAKAALGTPVGATTYEAWRVANRPDLPHWKTLRVRGAGIQARVGRGGKFKFTDQDMDRAVSRARQWCGCDVLKWSDYQKWFKEVGKQEGAPSPGTLRYRKVRLIEPTRGNRGRRRARAEA